MGRSCGLATIWTIDGCRRGIAPLVCIDDPATAAETCRHAILLWRCAIAKDEE